ncbi:hypothetical protein [Phaeobacter sp.]|uniref:hypothetical protein n=1 Tax=Phaeobacter sp. TaxID=1902409 RepID=UPI0025F2041D|nr:hypothetical protein [Phaeobacter sp.]
MKLEDLMGYIIDQLEEGLTGGTADLPLPANTQLNWLSPGMSLDETFFDFAIAGPFAGPTPTTLEYFRELVETLMGPQQPQSPDLGEAEVRPMGLDRAQAIEEAKRLYQQHLLGCWEQWSRLVDFIPAAAPTEADSSWSAEPGAGQNKHVSVVYGQSNRKLSTVYKDTLQMCEVADDTLSAAEQATLERMKALLSTEQEVVDLLGNTRVEPVPSPALQAYGTYKQAYEDAVIDYAMRLARSNNGSAADAAEFQQSGGIYRQRAIQAQRDWIARGYKNDVERAQAAINHITGKSMVLWKDNLLQTVLNQENATTGQFGAAFAPASVIPGGFARSGGWSRFSEKSLTRTVRSSRQIQGGGGRMGLSLGAFTLGGGAGGSRMSQSMDLSRSEFGIEFDYTAVEIMRTAFEPSFFDSRGWRASASFRRDYQTDQHSDGGAPPVGAMIGYPTKALFVRNLVIHSSEVASYLRAKQSAANGGGFVGIGPFVIGGRYQQSNRSSKRNYEIDDATIRVQGMQLIGFLSHRFNKTSDPSPDIQAWI